MAASPALVWFRQDLRLSDNPALDAARQRGGGVIPVYIRSPEEEQPWPPGEAARGWIAASLRALDADLRQRDSRLVLRRGPAAESLAELLEATGAGALFWNRRYEPAAVAQERRVVETLHRDYPAVRLESGNASLLCEPWEVMTGAGRPYQVFTPFARACMARLDGPLGAQRTRSATQACSTSQAHSASQAHSTSHAAPASSSRPRNIAAPSRWPSSMTLGSLFRSGAVHAGWNPGEAGARLALRRFLDRGLSRYAEDRDRPERGTSRLSPHLHYGEISSRRVLSAVRRRAASSAEPGHIRGAESYARQMLWREFAHHLLHHFPHTPNRPLRPQFAAFPWLDAPASLEAWKAGRTGHPIVDAGMRQLLTTGWMPNRVRMIAASVLVKDLLIPWQEGARWFWERLVDADLANNTLGWQWVAGCGADASPWIRVFNPVVQGERFDPHGAYVRRWLPEFATLSSRWIHRPWQAPASALADAGMEAAPPPLVDHDAARRRALSAFESVRRRREAAHRQEDERRPKDERGPKDARWPKDTRRRKNARRRRDTP